MGVLDDLYASELDVKVADWMSEPVDYEEDTLRFKKQQKIKKKAEQKAYKIDPKANERWEYKAQGALNKIKGAYNYLMPETWEKDKYYLDKDGTEWLLNEDNDKKLVKGHLTDDGFKADGYQMVIAHL